MSWPPAFLFLPDEPPGLSVSPHTFLPDLPIQGQNAPGDPLTIWHLVEITAGCKHLPGAAQVEPILHLCSLMTISSFTVVSVSPTTQGLLTGAGPGTQLQNCLTHKWVTGSLCRDTSPCYKSLLCKALFSAVATECFAPGI